MEIQEQGGAGDSPGEAETYGSVGMRTRRRRALALGCSPWRLAGSGVLEHPEEEGHANERCAHRRILAGGPAEVALISGPKRVEGKANRSVEREEQTHEKARGARPAVEQEEERREGNRVEKLKQAEA